MKLIILFLLVLSLIQCTKNEDKMSAKKSQSPSLPITPPPEKPRQISQIAFVQFTKLDNKFESLIPAFFRSAKVKHCWRASDVGIETSKNSVCIQILPWDKDTKIATDGSSLRTERLVKVSIIKFKPDKLVSAKIEILQQTDKKIKSLWISEPIFIPKGAKHKEFTAEIKSPLLAQLLSQKIIEESLTVLLNPQNSQ